MYAVAADNNACVLAAYSINIGLLIIAWWHSFNTENSDCYNIIVWDFFAVAISKLILNYDLTAQAVLDV